jgi:hypothetical protein
LECKDNYFLQLFDEKAVIGIEKQHGRMSILKVMLLPASDLKKNMARILNLKL